MKSHVITAVAGLLALSACASDNKLVGRPGMTVVQDKDLPAPSRQDLLLQQRSYLIGPMDRVAIDVYGLPDVSRTVQVDASGTIALPLVGTLEASGKTPAELSTLIATKLRGKYMRDPQVSVTADSLSQSITVDGEVMKPGQYAVNGRMTLMRAVAAAAGTTQYADTNFVVVFRQVDGQQMAALYDLRAIRQGIYADPEVYTNDVILVGESAGRRLFSTVIATGALVTAPVVALIQRF